MNAKERIRIAKIYERRLKEMVPQTYAAFVISMKDQIQGLHYDDILAVLEETQDLWNQASNGLIDLVEECREAYGIDIMTAYTAEEIGEENGDEI